MTRRAPVSGQTDATDIKSTGLIHDIVEPLYGPREEIARCPDCGRETLWCDREHLTHAEGCALR
jgi:hypothetical protein